MRRGTSVAPMITGGPTAYHVLAKPIGPICNLDCAYCFIARTEPKAVIK